MKKVTIFFSMAFAILMLNSCATILSKSTYPFTVNTNPSGVDVIIKDKNGIEIFKGTSPASINLKASEGFFKKAAYTVHVSSDGYKEQILPINFKIDGWYFGNLLIGGVIGMLIVDPATGAMFKIENEYMNINLSQSTANIESPTLQIYDIANTPEEWKGKLVRINP